RAVARRDRLDRAMLDRATPVDTRKNLKLAPTRKKGSFAIDADDKTLRGLVLASGPARPARDTGAPNYDVIPAEYYLPKTLADADLPKGVQNLLKETPLGSSEAKAKQRLNIKGIDRT